MPEPIGRGHLPRSTACRRALPGGRPGGWRAGRSDRSSVTLPEPPRGLRRLSSGELTLDPDPSTWPYWLRQLGPAHAWFTLRAADGEDDPAPTTRAVVATSLADNTERTWRSQATVYFVHCIVDGKVGWHEPDASGSGPAGPDPVVLADHLVASGTDADDRAGLVQEIATHADDPKQLRKLLQDRLGRGRTAVGTLAARVEALDRLCYQRRLHAGPRDNPLVMRTLAGLQALFPDAPVAHSEIFTLDELRAVVMAIVRPDDEEWRDAALVLALRSDDAGRPTAQALADWRWQQDVTTRSDGSFAVRHRSGWREIRPGGTTVAVDGVGHVDLHCALTALADQQAPGQQVFVRDRTTARRRSIRGAEARAQHAPVPPPSDAIAAAPRPRGFSPQGLRDHLARLAASAGVASASPRDWSAAQLELLVRAALLPLEAARDRAALLLAYSAGGLRRSELSNADVNTVLGTGGDLDVFVPWAKQDQRAAGRTILVDGAPGSPLDPVNAVRQWLLRYAQVASMRGLPPTWPLFPGLDGRFALRRLRATLGAEPERLAPGGVGLVLRRWFTATGLAGVTSHGVRGSLISHLFDAGLRDTEVAARTGQTPHIALTYWDSYKAALARARAWKTRGRRGRG